MKNRLSPLIPLGKYSEYQKSNVEFGTNIKGLVIKFNYAIAQRYSEM